MNDLHIQHYPLERLIPYARNARTHADEQISQIAGSIAEFGFVNPILIGDDNVIIAGHGRLMAAHRLGLQTVPVIMLAHLSETQRRALVIADNKIAENAGWDEEMLRLELQALNDADFDLDITGFDFEDLERLLNGDAQENQGLTDDDAAPEVTENPISQPGDLWLLGDHRVLCGSATVLADLEKVMGGNLADMVFTDPPYNVDYVATRSRQK